MYKVIYSKQSQRTLLKLPRNLAKRIRARLDYIALDPYVQDNNVIKLQDRPGYRLRVGDWRIIYEIHDGELLILALKIAPRGSVYR